MRKRSQDKGALEAAIARATLSASTGGGPFGAVLVGKHPKTGEIVTFTDNNHVTERNDPTAHAEVSVIRLACDEMDVYSLKGFTLYSSCEPCPMCLSSSLWARVDRVFFAADRHDAARAGFDDLAFYKLLGIKVRRLRFLKRIKMKNATAPFEAWSNNAKKVDY